MSGVQELIPNAPVASLKETRVDLAPYALNSTIHIQIPTSSTFSRARVTRRVWDTLRASKDEKEFRKIHIASAGNVFFRPGKKYPGSILWRLLEDDQVLELRSVDTSKPHSLQNDASITLRLGLPVAARRGCIALANSSRSKDIHDTGVYIVTKSNELYTFTIPNYFITNAIASEGDLATIYQVTRPSSFAVGTPHFLIAVDGTTLLAGTGDGRLIRLSRGEVGNTTAWQEAAYTEGHWGSSLRGLIRWQGSNTVRYDGATLDQNTPLNTAFSPEREHLFAVCLNHTLRAWNVQSGQLVLSKDLLDRPHQPKQTSNYLLDPSFNRYMQIFTSMGYAGDQYYITTYSPHDGGSLKFWGVRDASFASHSGLRDMFPDAVLRIPDPDDGANWTLSEFQILTSPDDSSLDVWILIRLNRRYKLYRRQFGDMSLDEEWPFGWSLMETESASRPTAPRSSSSDAEDLSSKWLDFVCSPGGIPEAVLETSLSIFNQTRGISTPNGRSLHEQIGSSVPSTVNLALKDGMASLPAQELAEQWNSFWTIITELDRYRFEPLSLACNDKEGKICVVLADACVAVRLCSSLERFVLNKPNGPSDVASSQGILRSIEEGNSVFEPPPPEAVMHLLHMATKFRETFPSSLANSCQDSLRTELWQESPFSVPGRIDAFYDRCSFSSLVSKDQFDGVISSIKHIGGPSKVTTDLFEAILETLPGAMSDSPSDLLSTSFGLKLLTAGAREQVEIYYKFLSNLLFLAVFLDIETDSHDQPLHNFDSSLVFSALIQRLRVFAILRWLMDAVPSTPPSSAESDTSSPTLTSKQAPIIQSLFATDLRPQSSEEGGFIQAFTKSIEDLLAWVSGGNASEISLDEVITHIQCYLLKNNYLDLARSFLQYQPLTAWSMYVRARLSLLLGDNSEAALYFQKAAYKLSRPTPPSAFYGQASKGLLDSLTASFLASGLPNYYSHIISLFSAARAHVQVASFAALALQHSSPLSTPASREQHSDLLARLFHSSLSTSDYTVAYNALTRYTDTTLRRSALNDLLASMVRNNAVAEFLALPFVGLRSEVEGLLIQRAKDEDASGWPDGTPGRLLPQNTSSSPPPFYKILYAYRLSTGDMRGAAAVLIQRLESQKDSRSRRARTSLFGTGNSAARDADALMEEYLVGINALRIAGGGNGAQGRREDEEGWAFVNSAHGGKRKIVRLRDLRQEYQDEIDRRDRLDRGAFGIVGDADSDEEMGGA